MTRTGAQVRAKGRVTVVLLVGWLCGLGAPPGAGGQNLPKPESNPQRLERFSTQLEDLRQSLNIPGLSAAIVRDQNVIWAQGLGFADLERRLPATPQTPYRIASLTKPFASTLLMQLVEHGQLDLDEPMATYLGSVKDETIKVRHVLTHTSEGTPGDRYRYRGGRFASLTAVIETVSGRGFRELLATHILDKLEMTSSVPGQNILSAASQESVSLGPEALNRYQRVAGRLAQPYTLYGSNELIPVSHPPLGISASTGLISTVMDLAKYDVAMDRHVLLRSSTQERMFTPAVAHDGRLLPYGLGWFVQPHRGVKLIWHYGYWRHISALMLKIPKIRTTLIVLANSDALSAPFDLGAGDVMRSPLACTFFRLFVLEEAMGRRLPDPRWSQPADGFAAELAAFEGQRDGYGYACERAAHTALVTWREKKRAKARTAIPVDPNRYGAYLGQYAFNRQVRLTVFQQGPRLFIEPAGQPTFEIFPESEATFFPKTFEALFTFVKNDSGQVTHVVVHWQGEHWAPKMGSVHDASGAALDVVRWH